MEDVEWRDIGLCVCLAAGMLGVACKPLCDRDLSLRFSGGETAGAATDVVVPGLLCLRMPLHWDTVPLQSYMAFSFF